jgi:hypothetical protein
MADGPTSQAGEGAAMRDALSDVVKRGKEKASSIAEATRDAVHSTADAARDATSRATGDLADSVAKRANSSAESLLHLADKLGEGKEGIGEPWMASLVGQAEASLRSVSIYLAASKPDRYVSDLNEFARKNPAIALGGAVAIGFLLARVGKTAVHELSDPGSTSSQDAPKTQSKDAWASAPANSIPAE